jgi:hypothetical protein
LILYRRFITAETCSKVGESGEEASVLLSTEAERVTGGIKEYSDVLLGLVRRHRRSERDCLGDSRVEVAYLKVEVHHWALVSRFRWPDRWLKVKGLLEDDVYRSVGRRDDCGARFFVNDGPIEQLGIETCEGAWIRSFNGGAPPHAVQSRVHISR